MMKLVHRRQGKLRVPICVHCSAGCGRTGVICTVDYVRSLLKRKLIGGGFSILEMVREMRRQRPAAVQTKDQYEFIYRIVAQMFRKVLENSKPDYENWSKDLRPSLGPSVRQTPLLKPAPSPKPPSTHVAPALGPRPHTTEPMPKEGAACDTYAVVARPKSGVGAGQKPPAHPSQASAGCNYENLAQGAMPNRETSLYSTVIVKEVPRPAAATTQTRYAHADPSPKAQEAHGSGMVPAYATLDFGQPGSNSRGSPSSVPHDAVDTESWAPSLPVRTADSYIVQNA
ncbi:tyrosine-protein phosphatase non-receptor type 18-like, partial [Mustelus asterias]